MGERKFCYRCMEKYDSASPVCPNCGYDGSAPVNPMYVAPGTILHDRYLVGNLIEYNGEGATYIGHDTSTGCKITLREYMPINLCTRVKNKATISVNYNDLAKYKAFMAEYTELNKSLARLRNDSNINPVLDMFAENNTTYTVFEHIEGVKMLDYLKENAGELSWEQVSKLFPPLFTTIGRLHNAGIIHRAISPETVYITEKGELRLSGFCVSAVRTANAGLEYELFKGYAAPEQYSASSSSRQGSWTDVYGVCALIYRALTGCMPDDSTNRLKRDSLHEPAMLNSRIPAHVSRVIMDGMNLSGRDRIQTITELVTRLFEQPAAPKTPAYASRPEQDEPPTRRPVQQDYPQRQYAQPARQPQQPAYAPPPQAYPQRRNDYDDEYRYEKVNNVDRIKVPIIIGILLLAILMIIAVVIFNILGVGGSGTSSAKSSRPSTTDNVVSGTTDPNEALTGPKDTEVPNLKGKFYENIKEKWADYFVLDPTYEFNDQYDNDMIFEQDIEPNSLVAAGTVIKVKVSKGKETAIIPDYKGCTVPQFKSRLEAAGISDFNCEFVASTSSYYGTPNTVIELKVDGKSVAAGASYSNKEGKKLMIYYVPEAGGNQPATTQWTETTTAPQQSPQETPTEYVEPPTEYVPPPTEYVPPPTEYVPPPTNPPQQQDPPPDDPGYETW